jgi:uncharacterized membrane protein
MAEIGKQRLAYFDWMRGLACLLMFQTHCYDSWLGGAARQTSFFGWSQLGGTLPAPLFLFFAGVSCALVTDRMRRKSAAPNQVANAIAIRGAQIFGLGLLFRVQEFALGWPRAPWTDLLRVDVLNVIGLSILFMALVCRITQDRAANAILAAAVALAIALATPPLWTTWRPRWLPWYLESYINGVHTFDVPQPWLFPVFPWVAFAFAGLAIGLLLFSDWSTANPESAAMFVGVGGALVFLLSRWLDARPWRLYASYDYWHTSPNFFLARVGILLVIMCAVYIWCRWGFGQLGFSPLLRLGQASLLIYWVHIEFVYGRFSILRKRAQTIPSATLGLVAITTSMVLLATLRTSWKGRSAEFWVLLRRALRPAQLG